MEIKPATSGKPRDFWCVVALAHYSGDKNPPYTNHCPVMLQSEDCTRTELLPELDFFECGGEGDWTKGRPSGFYRLRLFPVGLPNSEGIVDDVLIRVTEVTALCTTGGPEPINIDTGYMCDPVTGA